MMLVKRLLNLGKVDYKLQEWKLMACVECKLPLWFPSNFSNKYNYSSTLLSVCDKVRIIFALDCKLF